MQVLRTSDYIRQGGRHTWVRMFCRYGVMKRVRVSMILCSDTTQLGSIPLLHKMHQGYYQNVFLKVIVHLHPWTMHQISPYLWHLLHSNPLFQLSLSFSFSRQPFLLQVYPSLFHFNPLSFRSLSLSSLSQVSLSLLLVPFTLSLRSRFLSHSPLLAGSTGS